MSAPLSLEIQSKISNWQQDFFDQETKDEITKLQENPKLIELHL